MLMYPGMTVLDLIGPQAMFGALMGGKVYLVAKTPDPVTSDARSFIRRYHWTFPVLRDPEGNVGLKYGITALPTTFLINPEGQIARTLAGPQNVRSLRRALESLITI